MANGWFGLFVSMYTWSARNEKVVKRSAAGQRLRGASRLLRTCDLVDDSVGVRVGLNVFFFENEIGGGHLADASVVS